MNAQQINNLIAYLHSIQISADEAKQAATDAANAELERLQNLDDEPRRPSRRGPRGEGRGRTGGTDRRRHGRPRSGPRSS